MTHAHRHGSASSILLVFLLLLAQWTGFAVVLCVSGPDHVRVEDITSRCCAPRTSCGAGISEDANDSCMGCTDMPLQTASAWDPGHRIDTAGAFAEIGMPAGDPVRPAAAKEVLAVYRLPLPPGPSDAIAPLRC